MKINIKFGYALFSTLLSVSWYKKLALSFYLSHNILTMGYYKWWNNNMITIQLFMCSTHLQGPLHCVCEIVSLSAFLRSNATFYHTYNILDCRMYGQMSTATIAGWRCSQNGTGSSLSNVPKHDAHWSWHNHTSWTDDYLPVTEGQVKEML